MPRREILAATERLQYQYAPFHTKVINATVRDATHVLDGLLYHESDLRIREHYTDTAGFTNHVFALCHLLGFRFAPRFPVDPFPTFPVLTTSPTRGDSPASRTP